MKKPFLFIIILGICFFTSSAFAGVIDIDITMKPKPKPDTQFLEFPRTILTTPPNNTAKFYADGKELTQKNDGDYVKIYITRSSSDKKITLKQPGYADVSFTLESGLSNDKIQNLKYYILPNTLMGGAITTVGLVIVPPLGLIGGPMILANGLAADLENMFANAPAAIANDPLYEYDNIDIIESKLKETLRERLPVRPVTDVSASH